MTPDALVKVLEFHSRFLEGLRESARANLAMEVLSGIDLTGVNLSEAKLTGANLSRCILWSANLSQCDLFAIDLSNADLTKADLSESDLRGAYLRGVDLSYANLKNTDLRDGLLLTQDEKKKRSLSKYMTVTARTIHAPHSTAPTSAARGSDNWRSTKPI